MHPLRDPAATPTTVAEPTPHHRTRNVGLWTAASTPSTGRLRSPSGGPSTGRWRCRAPGAAGGSEALTGWVGRDPAFAGQLDQVGPDRQLGRRVQGRVDLGVDPGHDLGRGAVAGGQGG